MKEKVNNKLVEEVSRELDELGSLDVGSEEYKTTVNGVTSLVDRVIEINKFDHDLENRKKESELKENQMKEDVKDRWIRNGLTAAGIVVPTVLTIWGTFKTLKFEEIGTITTTSGRHFFKNLFK